MSNIDYFKGTSNYEQRGVCCPYCLLDLDLYPAANNVEDAEEGVCKRCSKKFIMWKGSELKYYAAPYKD